MSREKNPWDARAPRVVGEKDTHIHTHTHTHTHARTHARTIHALERVFRPIGGVAEKTNDVLFLCASAGYDVCIVESVGLGQSEVEIDQAVDMLLLVIPPGR